MKKEYLASRALHELFYFREGSHALDQDSNENPPKRRLIDCLLTDVRSLEGHTTIDLEIDSYFKEPVFVADPLLWWKNNETKFPRIAKMAKKFLAIPASEVASERSFSTAGLTVSKLRCSLDPANVDQLTFLHHNADFKYDFDTSASCTLNQ